MKKIVVCLMIFLVTNVAQANMSPKPKKCPQVSAFTFTTNDLIEEITGDEKKMWHVQALGKYGTQERWFFGTVPSIEAANKEDAYIKLRKLTATLKFVSGPTEGPFDSWSCMYAGKEFGAAAITGISSENYPTMKQILKK